MVCPKVDIRLFRIKPPNFPEPGFQFRMLTIEKGTYLTEIVLYFETDIVVRVQLNPVDGRVIRFFEMVMEREVPPMVQVLVPTMNT